MLAKWYVFMYKKVMIAIALLPILGAPVLELPILEAGAVQLRDGKTYFVHLPTLIEAESTVNRIYARNATYYFSIALPPNMGENLQKLEIFQAEGFEAIEFLPDETVAYLQLESGDRINLSGKAEFFQNQDQSPKKLIVTFDPPIPAQNNLNRKLVVGIRPVRNPRYDGVYLFGVSASPQGDRPNTQFLGYGRLSFYDPFR